MRKIYIAGPDVFEQDSKDIGKRYSNLCKEYGYEGLYPLDNVVDFNQEKKKIAKDIYKANKNLIDSCDIVIANLNSFRGKESDSGTVWECGYATAKGKKVYGYLHRHNSYQEQFTSEEKMSSKDGFIDLQGRVIEDFDYPVNLMIACSVETIVVGNFEDVLKILEN